MIPRLRPYLLGILGIAAITFPFLWLQLRPDFDNNTITVAWAPLHGLQFFNDLLPVFIIALLIWAGNRANRQWDLGQTIARNPAFQKARSVWEHSWAWIAMPLVLCGPAFLSPSTLGLFSNVGIYMLLALGLNITVGMTGLLVLGYAGFFAFGAYFFALVQQNIPYFPWWLAAPLAFPLGGLVGYLLGLPCLRLRGDYLAIVTLGFAEAFRETIRNLDVAGVLSAAQVGFVSPAMCEFQQSVMVLAMVILGGLGNSYGALLGAGLLYLVPEYLKRLSMLQDNATFVAVVPSFLRDSLAHLSDYRLLLFGAVMVIMMLYRPQGLLGSSRRKTEMLHP